jgi:PPOX class probable F420-dependent enzyme
MASHALPDPSTPLGERARARLRDEKVVWLTTVGADGTPQPNPVWFLWDGDTILVYNLDVNRVRHVRERPQVSLNFDTDGKGSDVLVIAGRAEIIPDAPLCHEVPEYVAKYGEDMVQISGSREKFGEQFHVAMRVHPTKVRGF